jgi:flagellar biosynthesis protein FlhG
MYMSFVTLNKTNKKISVIPIGCMVSRLVSDGRSLRRREQNMNEFSGHPDHGAQAFEAKDALVQTRMPHPVLPEDSQYRRSPLLARRHPGWVMGLPQYLDPGRRTPPVIIAVGGGKGGVGKSLVSANLAVRLAATGKKVLAIDLDVGGANLHSYFGLGIPRFNLADAVMNRTRSLSDVIVPTSIAGVSLIAGGREEALGGIGAVSEQVVSSVFDLVLSAREQNLAEFVILDLGAGAHRYTIDFFSLAHAGVVAALPEPTSIENAYVFLKSMLFAFTERIGTRMNMPEAAQKVRDTLAGNLPVPGGVRANSYLEKINALMREEPQFVSQLLAAVSGRTLGIIVNQIRCQKDIDVGRSMETIAERYFGFTAKSLGYLNYDDAAWKSLRNRRLLVLDFPHSLLSKRFSEMARSLLMSLGL